MLSMVNIMSSQHIKNTEMYKKTLKIIAKNQFNVN